MLSGGVRYLNAYLVVGPGTDARRSVPQVASWRVAKHRKEEPDRIDVYDLAVDQSQWPAEQVAKVREVYPTIEGVDTWIGFLSRVDRVHHQRDRMVGRATEDRGAVFRYQGLAAAQDFAGLIAIDADDHGAAQSLADSIRNALGDEILFGRSRRAGYGGAAKISWQPL